VPSSPSINAATFPINHCPVQANDHKHLGSITGSSQALAIAQFQQTFDGLTVFVTHNNAQALNLADDIQFFAGDVPVFALPDWETLPYDQFSPHQDIISQRLKVLYELSTSKSGILIISIGTLLQRLAPVEYIQGQVFSVFKGQTIDERTLSNTLTKAGYNKVANVYEHGEFAIRGSIIDVYPMGAKHPVRLDLFDDEVDDIKMFDAETQRSLSSKTKLDKLLILPAHEFPMDETGIANFRQNFRETFDVSWKNCPVYQDISEGVISGGIEYFLPLFYESTATLFDYFPEKTLLINQSDLVAAAGDVILDVQTRYEERRHDIQRPILSPFDLWLREDECFSQFKRFARITLTKEILTPSVGSQNIAAQVASDYLIDHRAQQPLSAIQTLLIDSQTSGKRILLCAETAGRRETLLDLLRDIKISPTTVESWQDFLIVPDAICITVAALERGFELTDHNLIIVAESQLFGQIAVSKRSSNKRGKEFAENYVKNLSELKHGDAVVHADNGVGRYLGLQTIDAGGQVNEFVTLEYANEAKLYVPVADLHLISRYSGGDGVQLNRLGNERWSAAKRKAAEKIRDTAAELLSVYAQREARKGIQFDAPGEDYRQFCSQFPFEETPDQEVTINNVMQDMMKVKPMDRLVCGDVGFGKTEVAMRAAFIAAHNGYQVMILVPTTLLSQQHYENFKDRFADWPIRVETLSRFNTAKQTKTIIEGLENGSVDIVVGTHKLLQKDIKAKRLGLLIIDEEHRFGVGQKEKIRQLAANVDILTMTATPIPRTLNMAMASIRDLSIIATPPAKRLSVKTFVKESNDALIKEALVREIHRGGQVYFLHNEVSSIEKKAEELQKLLPEARIVIGHGQMNERQLEQVMNDFYHKRFNILVCTTIIETGIDIPTANTILINRADKFGLAQLHQLRGRVGRSHHQAYCYLLTQNPKTLSKDAVKRLDAICEAQDLGAGFMLASQDMEIRGAGELLGDEQSGHIQTIGFSMYMDMLERAVKALQNGEDIDLLNDSGNGAEINLRLPALIPDDYMPDVNNRLTFYKRISGAENKEAIKALKIELIDRFGLLPEPINNLFRTAEIRQRLIPLGIKRIDMGDEGGTIDFASVTSVDPMRIIQLVQQRPHLFKLNRGDSLKFMFETDTAQQRFDTLSDIITQLTKTA
jgi:transcription-repair coupling factor (superfamily II helicase)